MKDKAEHIARVAISYRRQNVINFWIDSQRVNNQDDMEYWAQTIRDLNDAHAYFVYGEPKESPMRVLAEPHHEAAAFETLPVPSPSR